MRVIVRLTIAAWLIAVVFAMTNTGSSGTADAFRYLICLPGGQGLQTLFLDLEIP